MLNKDKIIQALNLLHYGSKGWMRSETCRCPECDHNDKFGILFTKDSALVNCQRCNYSNSLYNYLKKIGRNDLLDFKKEYKLFKGLESLNDIEEEKDNVLSTKPPPLGFKRIYYNDYLDDRGFLPYQYNQYNVGTSTENRLQNYVVFLMKQFGNIVGWLARSQYSKEWHEHNLKRFKETNGEVDLKLRYINSFKTDFDHILLGIDEITKETHTVYIVEGLMDKANVDRQLSLYKNNSIKCCATFGNKVSIYQQKLLQNTNVKNIILLFDYGTIRQSKKYALELSNKFNVKIAEFRDKDIDAGDATEKYLHNVLVNSKDFLYFYNYRINEIKLK